MTKSTSFVLGEYFENFINAQIASGRYHSASEVMREALRKLAEEEEQKEYIRQALIEGENSGEPRPWEMVRQELSEKYNLPDSHA